MSEKVLFYVFGAIAVSSSILAISRRQPIFGVLYLFITGLTISLLFAIKNAFFLALIQMIVYVGAVLVLFVFVIAMINLRPHELIFGVLGRWRYVVFPIAIALAAIIGSTLFSETSLREQRFMYFTAKEVGGSLYKSLVFQFEYLSIILIVAIVVTIFVGSRFERKTKEESKR